MSFFLQGHMDIDERSLWFDKTFNQETGGYFIKNDPVVRKVIDLDYHDNVRKDMLILLARSIAERKINGAIAELGVYKGATAKLLHYYFPERELLLFDTFCGFNKKDINKEKLVSGLIVDEQHFSNTSVEKVLKHIAPLNNNIRIIQGCFPESITTEAEGRNYALVHLDADLYYPTLEGLRFFYKNLSEGGFIIVHDYNAWQGARLAVEEFIRETNILPVPMPDKSGSCLIVKETKELL